MQENAPEIPLSDVAWLSRIARTLTRDEALADDLAQDVWMIARETPPPDGEIKRSWLARVLQRRHLRSIRSGERRERREMMASRDEGTSSTSELVERAELQKTLASTLLELDEPFRTTLMRAVFDGRSSAEIAEEEGITVGAVRHRIRRARELLQERLTKKSGSDWREWRAMLVPFAALPTPTDQVVAASVAATTAKVGVASAATIGGLVMSTKYVAASVAVVVLGIWASTVLLQSDDGEEVFVDRRVVSSSSLEEQVTVRREARGIEQAEVVKPPVESTSPARSVEATPVVDQEEATVLVTGSFVVEDHFGEVFEGESGKVAVWVGRGDAPDAWLNAGELQDIIVKDGRWSHRFPRGAEAMFSLTFEFAGRGCRVTGRPKYGQLRDGQAIELQAKWVSPVELRVLDADTRQHLSGFKVVAGGRLLDRRFHPGGVSRDMVKAEEASSPLEFYPESFAEAVYWVYCEGYGWGRAPVDPAVDEEVEILLEKGESELIVRVEGDRANEAVLKLTTADGRVTEVGRALRRRGEFRLEGLPPGALQVRATVEAPHHSSVAQDINLVPGRNEVSLTLGSTELFQVRGRLTIPESWGEAKPTLNFLFRNSGPGGSQSTSSIFEKNVAFSEMKELAGLERTWEFDAGTMPPGNYVVGVKRWGWAESLTVGDGGEGALALEAPDKSVVTIRLLDDITGEPLPKAGVTFQMKPAAQDLWFGTTVKYPIVFDDASKTWQLTGARSDINLSVRATGYTDQWLVLKARDRDRELLLRMSRRALLKLEFFVDDQPINPDPMWLFKLTATRNGQQVSGGPSMRFGKGFELSIKGTGSCDVHFPDLEGFHPVPSATAQVEAGKQTVLRVNLNRK